MNPIREFYEWLFFFKPGQPFYECWKENSAIEMAIMVKFRPGTMKSWLITFWAFSQTIYLLFALELEHIGELALHSVHIPLFVQSFLTNLLAKGIQQSLFTFKRAFSLQLFCVWGIMMFFGKIAPFFPVLYGRNMFKQNFEPVCDYSSTSSTGIQENGFLVTVYCCLMEILQLFSQVPHLQDLVYEFIKPLN